MQWKGLALDELCVDFSMYIFFLEGRGGEGGGELTEKKIQFFFSTCLARFFNQVLFFNSSYKFFFYISTVSFLPHIFHIPKSFV